METVEDRLEVRDHDAAGIVRCVELLVVVKIGLYAGWTCFATCLGAIRWLAAKLAIIAIAVMLMSSFIIRTWIVVLLPTCWIVAMDTRCALVDIRIARLRPGTTALSIAQTFDELLVCFFAAAAFARSSARFFAAASSRSFSRSKVWTRF